MIIVVVLGGLRAGDLALASLRLMGMAAMVMSLLLVLVDLSRKGSSFSFV